MIIAWHVVVCAYGFWLPNDPRGSGSQYVGSDDLFRVAGRATPVTGGRSRACDPHHVAARLNAKARLKREPIEFTGIQARAIAAGFGWAATEGGYTIHACSVMPRHAHLVIARHARPVGRIVSHLKSRATHQLRKEGLIACNNPAELEKPSIWARGYWCVFLNSEMDVTRAVRYAENNPIKDGLRPQKWSFVVPFNGFGDSAPTGF
ncbi:MAG: transposase [Phycisphaerae bacterium]